MTALKILVVDDDRDNADSLSELFEIEGHDVTVAYSGQEAVDIYAVESFDVAFMDVMMPGKNGVESFLEIRRTKPDATVYMMTGYSVEQLLQQATKNGALGVLRKPLDISEVMGALSSILPEGIVLVANSDQDLGTELQKVIGSSGKKCELVTDYSTLSLRINLGDIDVLVLDRNLPLIDSIDLYASLRRSGKALPTVILSSIDDNESYSAELAKLDVTGVVSKPFDPEVLLQKLDEIAS